MAGNKPTSMFKAALKNMQLTCVRPVMDDINVVYDPRGIMSQSVIGRWLLQLDKCFLQGLLFLLSNISLVKHAFKISKRFWIIEPKEPWLT